MRISGSAPRGNPLPFIVLVIAGCVFPVLKSRGDATVTNCTQAALIAALGQGGNVIFTQDCSITLTNSLVISNNASLLAPGHAVSISGSNKFRLFAIQPGVTFQVDGFTLTGGLSSNGAALYISTGAFVTLTNCTLIANNATGAAGTDGDDGVSDPNGNGGNGTSGGTGRPANGGAIYNLGTLILQHCLVTSNTAAGGNGGSGGVGGDGGGGSYAAGKGGNGAAGALGRGGAIYNAGTTAVSDSSISVNAASGGAGGAGGDGGNTEANGGDGGNGSTGNIALGGAIYNSGALSVSNCTFSSNSARGGNGGAGGLAGSGRFPGIPGAGSNGATGSGAGIYSTQSVDVVSSAFSDNNAIAGATATAGRLANGNGLAGGRGADSFGGGLFLAGGGITNCTFYSNSVAGGAGGDGGDGSGNGNAGDGGNGGNGSGGGLYNTGMVALVNCTFSRCRASGGTNGSAGSGHFAGVNGSKGAARGGAVANGGSSFKLINSLLANSPSGGNGYGTFTDGGYNISSDATIALAGTSLKSTDPKLAALADNGGFTKTLALLSNSPAIDRIPPASAPAIDQRGIARPQGPKSDSGAYERVAGILILTQPQSQTQTNGGSVTFSVTALGDSLKYRWRFNSTFIPNATNTTYTIASVTVTNQGAYDVVITNSSGSVTSDAATLTVTSAPPLITAQPTNQTTSAGGTATFTVSAAGNPPLTYQWQFNSTSLSGGIGGSYTVTNASASDAGPYRVIITNAFGSVTSAVASLTVLIPPAITLASAVSNVMKLSFASQTGFSYIVEYKTNLAATNWTALQTNAGTGSPLTVQDYTTNGPNRFYRVRVR